MYGTCTADDFSFSSLSFYPNDQYRGTGSSDTAVQLCTPYSTSFSLYQVLTSYKTGKHQEQAACSPIDSEGNQTSQLSRVQLYSCTYSSTCYVYTVLDPKRLGRGAGEEFLVLAISVRA